MTMLATLGSLCLLKGPSETVRIADRIERRGMATQEEIKDLARVIRIFPVIFVSVIIMAFVFGGWVMSIQMSVTRVSEDTKDHSNQLKEMRDLFYRIDKKLPDLK